MRLLPYILLAILTQIGCTSTAQNLPYDVISLEELYNQKNYIPNQQIKTCGWATKQFENVQITVDKSLRHGSRAKGFGVIWLDEEPYTEKPEWRCITGVIEPISGWDDYPPDDDLIILSTGHGFQWVIVQKNMRRD